MKIYINFKSLTIIKIEREKPFYQGSNFIDRIRLLFDEVDTSCSPTAIFKLPTGRRIGPAYPIGIDDGSTRLIIEEEKSWYYYDFIISTEVGLLEHAGQLEASIVLNYYNDSGTVIKQAVIGTIVNEIVKTTVYGEGNIIVVGEDPEAILNNLNLAMATLSNRQTVMEAIWTAEGGKLMRVIQNTLPNVFPKTCIAFTENAIEFYYRGELILSLDSIGAQTGNLRVRNQLILKGADLGVTLNSLKRDVKTLADIILDENYANKLTGLQMAIRKEAIDRDKAIEVAIAKLVGGAPGVLDALNELAAALGNDPNFATTITSLIEEKYRDALGEIEILRMGIYEEVLPGYLSYSDLNFSNNELESIMEEVWSNA